MRPVRKKTSVDLSFIQGIVLLKKLLIHTGIYNYKYHTLKSTRSEGLIHDVELVFFSGRTTKVLPSLHYWLSDPCHFFLSYNSLKRILPIFLFLPNLWVKTAGF